MDIQQILGYIFLLITMGIILYLGRKTEKQKERIEYLERKNKLQELSMSKKYKGG